MLVRNVDYGTRSSRHSGKLNLVSPRHKRETEGGKSFGVAGLCMEQYPGDIRSKDSLYSFKVALRK
jgi:hypothetical protein